MQRLKLFIPLIVFVVLALLFLVVQKRIGEGSYDPQALPSALLDKPLPAFELPDLLTGQRVTNEAIAGEVALVNVWATWCPTCHYEHPWLVELAKQGVVILGVDYKDEPAKAKQWLADMGNPYRAVLDDRDGRFGLDLGVTGAPETYVVDRRGIVHLRYQGAIDEEVWRTLIQPLVNKLQGEAKGDS